MCLLRFLILSICSSFSAVPAPSNIRLAGSDVKSSVIAGIEPRMSKTLLTTGPFVHGTLNDTFQLLLNSNSVKSIFLVNTKVFFFKKSRFLLKCIQSNPSIETGLNFYLGNSILDVLGCHCGHGSWDFESSN